MRPRTLPGCRCETCGAVFRPRYGGANRFCSIACCATARRNDPAVVAAARELWTTHSAALIADILARETGEVFTRDRVIGIAHSYDFPPVPSRLGTARWRRA